MRIYKNYISFLLFFISSNCNAFEWHEHRNLGNVAISIAFDYFESTEDFKDIDYFMLEKWKQAKSELLFCQDKSLSICEVKKDLFSKSKRPYKPDIRYGDVVKGVDDMRYPKLIFSRFNEVKHYEVKGYPLTEAKLNRIIVPLFFKQTSQDMYKASSNNFQHFQGELFETMKSLHMEAIDVAESKNIFSALVMQALSDHFLHDIFAPGHVTTNRENSHDGVALAMHDWSNDYGADFKIEDKSWGDLEKILNHMIVNCEKYQLFYDKSGDPKEVNCNDDAINNDDQLFVMHQLLKNHETLRMYGDNSLYKNHTQTIFMLLVEVRAILDVMKSYSKARDSKKGNKTVIGDLDKTVNNFYSYTWSGTYDYNLREPIVPVAGIEFGNYDFEEDQVGKSYDILIYTVAGQAPVNGRSSSGEFSLEYVPLSFIGENKTLKNMIMQQPSEVCDVFSLCNFGMAIGAVAYRNDTLRGEGVQLRFIKVQPKISTLFSFYIRRLNYHDDGSVDDWRSSYGIRLDTGFSMYSAFIGLEEGYTYDEYNPKLDRGATVTFGIGIGIPLSRHFWHD